jgi:FAD/FMN-containing dehydrogenase
MVTGNCVGVGVGGFLLGGGMGALDSVDGLLCDRLRSAEFVLSDGSQVVADSMQNQELLWAACGAGGASLALMVSATVSTHSTDVVGKGVCARVEFPQSVDAEAALRQWLNFRQESTHLRMQIRDRQLVAFGCFFGETLESYGSLEQKTGISGYESEDKWSYDSWVDVIKFLGPAGDFGKHKPEVEDSELMKTSWAHAGWFNNLRSRSLLLGNFGETFEDPLVHALHQCMEGSGCDGSDGGCDRDGQECIFIPVGEKVRERSPSDTAFAHRSAHVSFEVISQIRDDQDAAWLDDIFHDMQSTSYSMGSYVNYPDLGLEDYHHMYWGSNYERLRELKERYDPEGLFAAPQPIV